MLSILIFIVNSGILCHSLKMSFILKSMFYAQLYLSSHKVHRFHIRYSLLFYCVVDVNETFLVLFCLLLHNLHFPI